MMKWANACYLLTAVTLALFFSVNPYVWAGSAYEEKGQSFQETKAKSEDGNPEVSLAKDIRSEEPQPVQKGAASITPNALGVRCKVLSDTGSTGTMGGGGSCGGFPRNC